MERTEQTKSAFEIEALEERIAPSATGFGAGGPNGNQGGWVDDGGQQVFIGYDPPHSAPQ